MTFSSPPAPVSWSARVRHLSIILTRFFSQTDTAGERDFAPFLRDLLAAWPYFQDHPGQLALLPTLNDANERSVAAALVRGAGRQTVILTGHYDVVGIENYGELSQWACEPEQLLPRLIASLEAGEGQAGGLPPADRLALEDLRSGHFLPGRGLLDMKSGLAAGLAVLERFSLLPESERRGSLLFLTVPDEEIASNGARTAAARLPELCALWGLELAAAINLDASNDPGDGTQGQAAYLGSIGKLLPSVYFVGRETHAGSPFDGVNAVRLAAELVRRVECDPALADTVGGELTAPPTCLKLSDTKTHYDVTTPTAALCYFNWLTLSRPPGQVMETLKTLAGEAMQSALEGLRASAAVYWQQAELNSPKPDWQAAVYSFAEVKEHALQRGGKSFAEMFQELERRLAADPQLDTPAICLRLTEAAWQAGGLVGPAAVVGFASLPYSPALDGQEPAGDPVFARRSERLRAAIQHNAALLSHRYATPIALRPFFPGISDISFFSGQVSAPDSALLAANTPAWSTRAGFDTSIPAALKLPAANIGPWGRDYHQRTERVNAPYSFEVLPELLWHITQELLSEEVFLD